MGSARITCTMKGLKEADEFLAMLPTAVRGATLEKAIRQQAKKVISRAKQLVPVRERRKTGKHLRDTLETVVKRYGNIIVVVMGPGWPAGAHGHLVEWGHRIARYGTGTLATFSASGKLVKRAAKSKRGAGFRGTGISDSRTREMPFMRPAWDEHKDGFEAGIVEAIRQAAMKARKKHG